MVERVNDLIPLIASQDQTGCSPGALTVGFGGVARLSSKPN